LPTTLRLLTVQQCDHRALAPSLPSVLPSLCVLESLSLRRLGGPLSPALSAALAVPSALLPSLRRFDVHCEPADAEEWGEEQLGHAALFGGWED